MIFFLSFFPDIRQNVCVVALFGEPKYPMNFGVSVFIFDGEADMAGPDASMRLLVWGSEDDRVERSPTPARCGGDQYI